MKFTEEQYQKIVEIADEYQSHSAFGIIGDVTQKSIGAEFYESELCVEIDFYENAKEIMAIVNPLTREWAHERFVEKEKKYVWRDKYTGYVIYKMLNDWSLSATALGEKHFTETEIENSPFKPEWFDKEEAE